MGGQVAYAKKRRVDELHPELRDRGEGKEKDRSPSTGYIPRVWNDLDLLLQNTLLTLRSSPRSLPSDSSIITLPVRLGGLGILSHSEVSPLPRAASNKTADRFLAPLLGIPINDDSISIEKQSSRVAEVVKARHSLLQSTRSPIEQLSLAENASILDRTALDAIPSSKAFSLSNREVSAALHAHTLCPSQGDYCRFGEENVFGHAEVYGPFPPWITARHEEIKRFIIPAINANPALVAVPEPPIAGSTLRTDFRVTSHSGATEYELSVISLSANKHSKSALRSL
jgi:hypothetical protein